jgi:hypothetical protein
VLGNCGLNFADDGADSVRIVCGCDHFDVATPVSDAHRGAMSEPIGVGIVNRVKVLGRVGGPVELERDHVGSSHFGVMFIEPCRAN